MNFIQKENAYCADLLKTLDVIEPFVIASGFSKTNHYLEALNEAISNTTVYFDYAHKPRVKNNISGLKKYARQLLDKYSGSNEFYKIEYILSRLSELNIANDLNICGESIYYPLFDESVRYDNPEMAKDMGDLRRKLLNTHHGWSVSGIYNHNTKTIVLYTKNIGNRPEEYISVFVHELFHAIHHNLFDINGVNAVTTRYHQQVVLESLAVFFQLHFLRIADFFDLAKDLLDKVEMHGPIFYPYSGCKKFINDIVCFNDLLELSYSMYDDIHFNPALKKMVDRYEYEIIMEIENMYTIDGIPNNLIDRASDNRNKNKSSTSKTGCDTSIESPRIHFFKVNQSNNFVKELANNWICGGTHWKKVLDIECGDIIFHEYKKEIVAISIALSDGYNAINEYGKCETCATVDYFLLETPWPIDYSHQQVYISQIDSDKAKHILSNISELNPNNSIVCLIAKMLDI